MPITQDRMKRLVEAGEDYQANYETLKAIAHAAKRKVMHGEISAEQALDEIIVQCGGVDLAWSMKVLGEERMHYRLTNAKNTYDRTRKRERYHAPTGEPRPALRAAIAMSNEGDEWASPSGPVASGPVASMLTPPRSLVPVPGDKLGPKDIIALDAETREYWRKQWNLADYYAKYPSECPVGWMRPSSHKPQWLLDEQNGGVELPPPED